MADGYVGLHTRRASAARTTSGGGIFGRANATQFAVDAAALSPDAPASAPGLVSGMRAFAEAHAGVTAVIEYAGRKGARIVLVAEDGTTDLDRYAESTDAARAACAKAGVTVEGEWERELTEQMRVSSDLWGARGRRALTR
jgi:hypothetical protein